MTPKSSLWVPVPTRWRASAVQASAPAVCFSPSAFSSPRSFTLSKGYTCLAAGSLFSAALLGQSNAGKERNYCNFHSRAKSWYYYYCNLGQQFSWGPKHFRHWTIAAIASSLPLLLFFSFAVFHFCWRVDLRDRRVRCCLLSVDQFWDNLFSSHQELGQPVSVKKKYEGQYIFIYVRHEIAQVILFFPHLNTKAKAVNESFAEEEIGRKLM